MIRTTIFLFTLFSFFFVCFAVFGVEPPDNLWKGLIAENTRTESYAEFYATARCYRNRIEKGMTLGCVAMKRKDLDAFVSENVSYVKRVLKRPIDEWAQRAVREAFRDGSADPTNGATHYEDVEIYGLPYWAKNKKVLAKIGIRTFFE